MKEPRGRVGQPEPPTTARLDRSGESEEDVAVEQRTMPFPYAERFARWVADETATSDGRRRQDHRGGIESGRRTRRRC